MRYNHGKVVARILGIILLSSVFTVAAFGSPDSQTATADEIQTDVEQTSQAEVAASPPTGTEQTSVGDESILPEMEDAHTGLINEPKAVDLEGVSPPPQDTNAEQGNPAPAPVVDEPAGVIADDYPAVNPKQKPEASARVAQERKEKPSSVATEARTNREAPATQEAKREATAKAAASHNRVEKPDSKIGKPSKQKTGLTKKKSIPQTKPKPTLKELAESDVLKVKQDHPGLIARIISATKGLISRAISWLGTRYIWGGISKKGVDCSGLTRLLYLSEGIKLPHSAKLQFKMGQEVSRSSLLPGDLVFFNTRGPISHVGLYIGNGKFVHAANPRRGVRVDSLDSQYYNKRYAGARRYKDFS